ncbi:MAG: TraR/DksA family transcriptional regulator [Candidatus Cyclobacteriaceae bacterium M2_1C_046]
MTDKEKIQLREAMEKKKDELIQVIIDLKEETKPMGLDNSIGRVSRMDYINNKSVNEAGLRKAENDLRGIDGWLSLYDTDKFGKCRRCGNEININRLLLMPASSHCIHCAGR